MVNTPNSLRTHIGIFGDTNSGKSLLFNNIIGQDMSIVSDKIGTTTDSVKKAMELISYGPVLLIDTAGLSDETSLGNLRMEKTNEILKEVDFALITIDVLNKNEESYEKLFSLINKYNIPYITIITKKDLLSEKDIEKAKETYEDPIFISSLNKDDIENLKVILSQKLESTAEKEKSMLDGLVKPMDDVLLVIPIDSESPKGRIILPQVQCIRECLDMGVICHICKDTELKETLLKLKKVDLVITDSQVFKKVNEIVPENIKLTSFSMLMARQKGDIKTMFNGLKVIDNLKDNDNILIAETCTHTTSHEDIGKVKIPNLLTKHTGKKLNFSYSSGFTFPKDIEKYSLVIHCGGCMITRRAMLKRLNEVTEKNIPITNYGVILSYLTGAYSRQEFIKE